MTLDHGGNLRDAIVRFGGAPEAWLDLSTGINPVPYPVDALDGSVWARLPGREVFEQAEAVARAAYRVADGAAVVAGAGASALEG
jgi:cobalamin biosynthetic protein CobC